MAGTAQLQLNIGGNWLPAAAPVSTTMPSACAAQHWLERPVVRSCDILIPHYCLACTARPSRRGDRVGLGFAAPFHRHERERGISLIRRPRIDRVPDLAGFRCVSAPA
jgi:hypothetical protein